MRTSRFFAFGALFLSFAWVLAGGCSSDASTPEAGTTGGTTGGTIGGTQGDPTIIKLDASASDGGPFNELNPLCGTLTLGSCLPDLADACRGYVPPANGAGGAGGANTGGEGGGGSGSASGASSVQGGAGGAKKARN